MKTDVKKLLFQFHFKQPRKGDLVLTAEIHRVIRIEKQWCGNGNDRTQSMVAVVVDVFPPCESCAKYAKTKRGKRDKHFNGECGHEHFMDIGIIGGQSSVMSPKPIRQQPAK